MPHRFGTAAWLAVVAAGLVACSDGTQPASPSYEAGPGEAAGLLDGAEQATVLKRTAPLAEEESVTRTIGPLGGALTLPRAGLTVTIPPLALEAPVAITVRAPPGDLVGYHFSPHGLAFALPVSALQDLTKTEAPLLGGLLGLGLRAAYFGGELAPVVSALEVLPVYPGAGGTAGVFRLVHFSGYVIATN